MFLHPDRFHQEPKASLQDNSHVLSSYASNSFATLSSDCERAAYLLKLRGFLSTGDEARITDPELVEKIFEMRMELEFVDDLDDLSKMRSQISEESTEQVQRVH